MIVDVRVDRNALVLLLTERRDYAPPRVKSLLTLRDVWRDEFRLVAVDLEPPASGPEAQLSYRVPKDGRDLEDRVKGEVEKAGLAVLAARIREES